MAINKGGRTPFRYTTLTTSTKFHVDTENKTFIMHYVCVILLLAYTFVYWWLHYIRMVVLYDSINWTYRVIIYNLWNRNELNRTKGGYGFITKSILGLVVFRKSVIFNHGLIKPVWGIVMYLWTQSIRLIISI